MSTENTTTKTPVTTPTVSAQHFFEGTILHSINVDKYTKEVKESFRIEAKEIGAKFNIKSATMIEIALLDKESKKFSSLLYNGWESTGTMSSGAGKAAKFHKTEDWYECTFFEGEVGKEFDPKKIQIKTFIKLSSEHLGAIFTFLRLNDEVKRVKAEELKIQRTTLEL
jgi:hypothetical protein